MGSGLFCKAAGHPQSTLLVDNSQLCSDGMQGEAENAVREASGKVARLEEAVREDALARVALQQAQEVHLRPYCTISRSHALACVPLVHFCTDVHAVLGIRIPC